MLLANIKKFAKKRAKAKNAAETPNRNVYGGVGVGGCGTHNHTNTNTNTTPEPAGDAGGGDGGGE